MKRLLNCLTALMTLIPIFSSCQKNVSEDKPVVKEVKVSIGDVQDSSFVFAVVPCGGIDTYAYAVTEGEPVKVEASAIMSGTVSGSIASGTRNYKNDASLMMPVEYLEPNTTYTVYAAAKDPQGLLTEVATATTTTSDSVDPGILSFECKGNTMIIEFSEDVIFVDESEITATPYCKMFLTGSPAGAAVQGTLKEVSGKKVTIDFPDITMPGTYYTVNYEEGTFTDSYGNPCDELASKFTSAVKPDGSCSYEGVYGYLENSDIVYVTPTSGDIDIAKFSTTALSVKVPAGVNRVDLVDKYVTTVTHEDSSFDVYPMMKVTNYYGSYYDVTVKFAGSVVAGDKVSITIPAGTLQDWYGNVNAKDIVLGPYKIFTNDTKNPEITAFSSEGNLLTIQFNEDVKYVSGDIKATPYYKMYVTGTPVSGAVTGSVKSVAGNKVTIEFATFTKPGTYYPVNIPAGAFTDLSCNPCEAVTSKFTGAVAADGTCPCNGIYGYIPNGEISIKVPSVTSIKLSEYSTKQISVSIPDGVTRVDLVDNYLTIVKHKDGSSDSFKMAKVTNYYGTYYDLVLKCAGTAAVGDIVTIAIPAAAIQDWYGNINAANIVVGPFQVVAD